MNPRLPLSAFPSPAVKALAAIDKHLHTTLEPRLLELVKLRASQLNGCAYCVDMHYKDARAAGETEQRLYGLSAWRDAPYYTEAERAALAWTEAVTRLGEHGVEDAVWVEARRHLDAPALANLTVAVIAINSWNRWNVAMRTEAGHYEVGMFG